MRWLLLVALVGCEPSRHVSSTTAAVISGAAAAATTAADPDYAAREEQNAKDEANVRGQKVKRTVPAEVFDQLDEQPPAPPPVPQEH